MAFFGSVASAALPIPGDFLVADSQNGNGHGLILQVNPNTGAQSVWASGGFLDQPTSLAFDGKGNLIVSDFENGYTGAIIRINLASGQQTEVATGNWMAGTTSVNVEQAGTYVALNDNSVDNPPSPSVVRIDPSTGAQSVIVSAPANSGSPLALPNHSVLDANGNILCTNAADDDGTTGVLKINSQSGAVSVVSSGGNFNTIAPSGILIDPSNSQNLLVSCEDYISPSQSDLLSVNIATGAQTVLATGGPLLAPIAIADDPSGDVFVSNFAHAYTAPGSFTTSFTTASIVRIDPVTGKETVVSSGGNLVTPQGMLYVPEPSSFSVTLFLGTFLFGRGKRFGRSK
jgi:hypothetical protein